MNLRCTNRNLNKFFNACLFVAKKEKRKSMPVTWTFESAKNFLSEGKVAMPETEEKFTNFANNRFQINDKKVVKQLWNHFIKN